MKISAALFLFMCTCAVTATAADAPTRPKDAAEAVQEGNVRNWVEYYERQQRANPPPQPARPKTDTTPATTEPQPARRQ